MTCQKENKMANNKLKGSNVSRQLPEVNPQLKSQLISEASFDTRPQQQKKDDNTKKTPKTPKALSLGPEGISILNDLTEITGKSERAILAELAEQALKMMAPKIEIAKEIGMVPSLILEKKS